MIGSRQSSTMRPWRVCIVLVVTLCPVLGLTAVQSAVDANAIKLDDMTYRLWGMDAPDRDQTCARDWPAGREAANALASLIQNKAIECEAKGQDREGRTLALCRADGADLAAAMVRAGMAWADLSVTQDYVVQEAKAAAGYLGLHGHHCKTAWDWRSRNRVEPQFHRQ